MDRLCREYIFARDRNNQRQVACVRCGTTKNPQWAHVYSRRYKSVRWEPLNSMVLCAGCHLLWHHRPIEALEWWQTWIGLDKANVLRLRFQEAGKIDKEALLMWFENRNRTLPG